MSVVDPVRNWKCLIIPSCATITHEVYEAKAMPESALTLILEGSPARNGNIPADVFVAKLRQFIATIYSFDRSYAGRAKRGVELEIFDLRKVNPAMVHFSSRSAVRGYDAHSSLEWTVRQMQAIESGRQPDPQVSQDALDNVIELASVRKTKLPTLSSMRLEFEGNKVTFDERIIGSAMVMRTARKVVLEEVWKAGVSRGSVLGELRGTTDLNGEKKFWITPPTGHVIQCLFSEELRASVQENLWRTCRVHGFLRYGTGSPRPYLIDAQKIEPLSADAPHLSDLKGAFRGLGDGSDIEELVDP